MTIGTMIQGQQVVHVAPDTPVSAVVALLAERRIGAVPVMTDGQVAGIFSERDLVHGLTREGAALLVRPVGEVMTAPAITVTPDVQVLAALALMTVRRIRHLPVLHGGELVGFVSIGDLVKRRIDGIEAEAGALRDYIQGA